MEKLTIIRTLTELKKLSEHLSDRDFIAFDTETTGLDKESEIIGFSVACDTDEGFYVILSYWDVTAQKLVYLETKEGAKDFLLSLKGKNLVMHNGGFDCSMVNNNYGVELIDSLHTDTMILGHMLDENRSNGLKELGVALYGDDSKKESQEMKASVAANGGVLTKDKYEMYKADADLMARYGAKDAILTIRLFYTMMPQLFEEGLDKFFFDESMPLLKGPTYDLNNTGMRVDPDKLRTLKGTLEAKIMENKAFIDKEVYEHVKHKYPGTGKTNVFNIMASQQRAWLVFEVLGNEFHSLTDRGREVCEYMGLKRPYSAKDKRIFRQACRERKGEVWRPESFNAKTGKQVRACKIDDSWKYMECGKASIYKIARTYKWAEVLQAYAKDLKLLNTYVEGIQSRMKYNVVRPSFLQHGTTSGRYACRNPNFQNLPRDDKRVKACIVSRPGMVLVGADYAQLEPRVFASYSKDVRLLNCFRVEDDFYSVTGVEIFDKQGCSLKKSAADSFASLFPFLRDISKAVTLSVTYGNTAYQLAQLLGITREEAHDIIDNYFERFPSVEKMMAESHEMVKRDGAVYSMFGRPRRLPKALVIKEIFGNAGHSELPYEVRNILNLAVNHRIQSTGASIMNRAAIAVHNEIKNHRPLDERWNDVHIITQIHDELVLEGPEALASEMTRILKDCMENTTKLPGVDLLAEPKVAYNLADLK